MKLKLVCSDSDCYLYSKEKKHSMINNPLHFVNNLCCVAVSAFAILCILPVVCHSLIQTLTHPHTEPD